MCQLIFITFQTHNAICDKEVENKIQKRSSSEENDNNDVYEVYGNNGFIGLAHLEDNSITPSLGSEEFLEYSPDNNEPIFIELDNMEGVYKDVNKRSRYGDDFIRLSRSDVKKDPAEKEDFIRLSRSDDLKRPPKRNDFIRLSRSSSVNRMLRLDEKRPAEKRGDMWKLRGGKRFSSGDRLNKRKETFIRLSRNSLEEPVLEPHKRIMWKFRAGKRANHVSSGDIWYYFRARK